MIRRSYIFNQADSENRLARWRNRLSEFDRKLSNHTDIKHQEPNRLLRLATNGKNNDPAEYYLPLLEMHTRNSKNTPSPTNKHCIFLSGSITSTCQTFRWPIVRSLLLRHIFTSVIRTASSTSFKTAFKLHAYASMDYHKSCYHHRSDSAFSRYHIIH